MQNQINAQPAMWSQAFKEAVESAISIYSHSGAGVQHAGDHPIQGGIGSSGGWGSDLAYSGADFPAGGTGGLGGGGGAGGSDFGGEIGV